MIVPGIFFKDVLFFLNLKMLNIDAFGCFWMLFPALPAKAVNHLFVLFAAFSTWRREGRKSAKQF